MCVFIVYFLLFFISFVFHAVLVQCLARNFDDGVRSVVKYYNPVTCVYRHLRFQKKHILSVSREVKERRTGILLKPAVRTCIIDTLLVAGGYLWTIIVTYPLTVAFLQCF